MLQRLKHSSKQGKQVALLYASSLLSILLGVLSSIVNTRFLAPADYGDVRYVQNIINFIASFLLFGYFLSGSRLMALSDDKLYCRRVKGMMVVILLFASVVLMSSLVVCWALHWNNSRVATLFLLSIPVCFVPLYFNYIEQTTQGDNQIGRLSLARLLPYLTYVPVAYLVYCYWGATSKMMILLQWGIYTLIYVSIIVSTRPVFRDLKPVWKKFQVENREYGIQLYWGSLIMVASNYLAGISLGAFNDDNVEVGFYTLALTVTSPLAALPSIVGTTYFKHFASQDRIPARVMKMTFVLTVFSCLLFLVMIQPVVTFLYSDRYASVGTYASFLSVAYCVHGFGDMVNKFLGAHGQGIAIRNASFANGIFKIIGFVALVAWFNTNGAIATVIICDFIYMGSLMYYYYKYVKVTSA